MRTCGCTRADESVYVSGLRKDESVEFAHRRRSLRPSADASRDRARSSEPATGPHGPSRGRRSAQRVGRRRRPRTRQLRPAAVGGGQDQRALPRSGRSSAPSARTRCRPSVMTVQSSSRTSVRGGAEGHHRLDGQAEARDQLDALAALARDVVQQVRVHVHLGADAVAAVVLDDPVLAGRRAGAGGGCRSRWPARCRPGGCPLHRGDARPTSTPRSPGRARSAPGRDRCRRTRCTPRRRASRRRSRRRRWR